MPPRPDGRAASDLLLFLLPTGIWGTTWLAIKFQLGVVAPEVSVAWRFGLASLLLLGWCAARGIPLRYSLRDHLAFILLGLLLFGANYVLVYRSETYLTSGLVAVLSSLMVFWNLLGARVFFGTSAPRAVLLGALLGFAGVALLFWPEVSSLRPGGAAGQATGIALALLSTLLSSAGTLFSQRLFSRGAAILPATALGMGWSALAVTVGCALAGIPFAFDPRPGYLLSLAYLAAFGSVVAFASYLTLVGRIGAGRTGYMTVVIPAVAMLVSTVFEGYRWSPGAVAGMALVLAGTALVLRARAA
jgi:drug/metabolite transporter (DMT)-like permease